MNRPSKPAVTNRRWLEPVIAGMLALLASVGANAQLQMPANACGSLANHYGPFDYRTEKGKLIIVESAHFTPVVEALVGSATGDMNKDIDYTLRTSPNHHRALITISKLTQRTANPQPTGFQFPLECYFERAVRFKPDDTIARLIFAQHLGRTKRVDDAQKQIDAALSLSEENALTQYNAGLILFEMGVHGRALKQAHVAMKMGFTRTELQDMLKKANQWQEPTE
jgi:hypothetical protein